MINHVCAQCQQNLQIPDEYAGQLGTCPKCGASITVPVDSFSPPALEQGGQGQAVASLVCGILSYLCLGLLTSVPAVILGHMSLSKIKRGVMPAGAWGVAVAGLVLGYINILVNGLAIVVVTFFSARWLTHMGRESLGFRRLPKQSKADGYCVQDVRRREQGFFPAAFGHARSVDGYQG